MREHPHPRTDSERESATWLAASAGGKQRDLLDSGVGLGTSPGQPGECGREHACGPQRSGEGGLRVVARASGPRLVRPLYPPLSRWRADHQQESKRQALRRQVGEDVARLLESVGLEDDSLLCGTIALCHTAPTGF